jgi:hypothetical protein
LIDLSARYLEYKVDLATEDDLASPMLHRLKVTRLRTSRVPLRKPAIKP